MKKNTTIFALVIIIIALIFAQLKTCKTINQSKDLYSSVNDTLTTYRNERGLIETYIDLIETDNANQFLKINSQDSTIKWLQKSVREYNGKLNTAIIANTTTSSEGGLKTLKIAQTDTVIIDSVKYVYPEYSVKWNNDWEIGSIKANKDSISRNIQVINKYEFTIGKPNNGWFKKREQKVTLTNLNPNTATKELRAFNIKSEPKRITLGLHLGVGITTNLKPTTYIGFGIGYTVLQIK